MVGEGMFTIHHDHIPPLRTSAVSRPTLHVADRRAAARASCEWTPQSRWRLRIPMPTAANNRIYP